MRALVPSAVVLTAGLAWADIAPPNTRTCQDKAAGTACTTDDGLPGTCKATMVSRPDYSSGIPPKSKQVSMMICEGTAPARARVVSPAWALGAAFTALFALLGLGAWRRRSAPPPGVGALLRARRGGPAA